MEDGMQDHLQVNFHEAEMKRRLLIHGMPAFHSWIPPNNQERTWDLTSDEQSEFLSLVVISYITPPTLGPIYPSWHILLLMIIGPLLLVDP
jgi:hypothetical protein